MASVPLLFLMAALVVSSVAASVAEQQQAQYPSKGTSLPDSNHVSKGLKFDEIIGSPSCSGAKGALEKARDKCCNDLGKRGKCICPAVRRAVDSIDFLKDLCSGYDACSAEDWNGPTENAAAKHECKVNDKENKAGECNAAVERLKEMHKDCVHFMSLPRGY